MLQWLRNRLPTRRGPAARRPRLIRRLEVRADVLEASRAETLRHPGRETMFLWTGRCSGDHCEARTLVLPKVERSEGRVRISREEMRRAGREMRARREILVLQIHTHPGSVPFSSVDEDEAADQGPGAIAMVVHRYGQTVWDCDHDAVIYERDDGGRWSPWPGKTRVRR